MIKTLYNSEEEKRGIEIGIEIGIKQGVMKVARNLINMGMDKYYIIKATELSKEEIEKLYN